MCSGLLQCQSCSYLLHSFQIEFMDQCQSSKDIYLVALSHPYPYQRKVQQASALLGAHHRTCQPILNHVTGLIWRFQSQHTSKDRNTLPQFGTPGNTYEKRCSSSRAEFRVLVGEGGRSWPNALQYLSV